jgi:glucokinase
MGRSDKSFLLGDIGGTNARFALFRDGALGPIETLPVDEFAGIAEAIGAYFARHHGGARASHACLAIASPIVGERCLIINSGWIVDTRELRGSFGFASVRLVNDFEAIGWSIPLLKSEDVFQIGAGRREASAPAVVFGPGTGLGMACFLPVSGDPVVIGSEGGHATMASGSGREDIVIDRLRKKFGHVSIERVLSGEGLENLYDALADIGAACVPTRGAAEITKAATEGNCAVCRDAVDMFCAFLGEVGGNLALTFAARGGIYVAGGIVPRIADLVARSAFRERFVAKGRFRDYLESIGSFIIVHPNPAFIGLSFLAAREQD